MTQSRHVTVHSRGHTGKTLKWIWLIDYFLWLIVYDSYCTIEECLTSDLVCLLWVCCVWFALPKENLVTMRNHHLFEIINTNWKIQIFQNEKSISTLHRAGPDSWTPRSNWPKLPVSTTRPSSYSPTESRCFRNQMFKTLLLVITSWILFAMTFA